MPMMSDLVCRKLDGLSNIVYLEVGKIITISQSIYTSLGPGFMEVVYHNALISELSKAGIKFVSRPMIPITYGEVCCGYTEPDLWLPSVPLIVELKSMARKMSNGERCQLHAQLRTSNCECGLLVNFRQQLGNADIEVDIVRLSESQEGTGPSGSCDTGGEDS